MSALTPYRAAYKESEITLTTAGSTWRMRLRLQVPRLLRIALFFGVAVGVIAGLIIGFAVFFVVPSLWILWMVLGAVGLWLLPVGWFTLAAALRALDPPELERALPASVSMRATGLHVVPREGRPFDTKWTFFCGYRALPSRVVLVLSRVPRLQIEIANEMLSPEGRKMLLRWLETERVPIDD